MAGANPSAFSQKKSTAAVALALFAALFYAINTPASKVLLNDVAPTYMAAFLYLGAGIGVGIMLLLVGTFLLSRGVSPVMRSVPCLKINMIH